jgi:hypothetical protein
MSSQTRVCGSSSAPAPRVPPTGPVRCCWTRTRGRIPRWPRKCIREGRIESPSDPATPALGDQRTYLYLEIDKDTTPANADLGPWVGVAVGVRLAGDPTIYRSDHLIASWSIKRDVPAATTVELPAGVTAADVVELIAYRVPAGDVDTGASVTVTDVNRAFFLDQDYLPQSSFIDWHGTVTLTPVVSEATIWSAGA